MNRIFFCIKSRECAEILQNNLIKLENYPTLSNVTLSILEVISGGPWEIDKLPMKCDSSGKSLTLDVSLDNSVCTSVQRTTLSPSPQKH